jgi:hypothetical protein
MGQVTEDLFALIHPAFKAEGFSFLKSKKTFIKKSSDFTFTVFYKFDGRGGLVFLEWIELKILNNKKKLLRFETIRNIYFEGEVIKLKIPTLYSQKALQLANDMNLRGLGQMNYEEKYPQEKIVQAAKVILELSKTEIFPFFKVSISEG